MNIHIIFAVKNLFIILVICNADWCEMHRSAMILLDFFLHQSDALNIYL